MQNKFLFGITGGSGTGKTTVSDVFRELGFEVIDCDVISRQVTKKGSPCLDELAARFGREILTGEGELDRRSLGAVVFSDPGSLQALNEITHKYILAEIFKEAEASEKLMIGVDGAVLFESGITDSLECVVGVISDRDKRIERIVARDGITPEAAEKRISSQKVDKFFIENCDYLIYNNNGRENLVEKVKEVGLRLEEEGKGKGLRF